MSRNPFNTFAIDSKITSDEIRNQLLEYRKQLISLSIIYQKYFEKIKTVGNASFHGRKNEIAEMLLSKRYEFGLNLDKIALNESELEDLIKSIKSSDEVNDKSQVPAKLKNKNSERAKKLEMFYMSSMEAVDTKISIDKAIDEYEKGTTKDDSKMMDILLEIRFRERVISITNNLANELSKQGYVCTAEEFKQLLMQSKSYNDLKSIYNEIDTKEKRDDLIPQLYVEKNMTDLTRYGVINPYFVEQLLKKEANYRSSYYNEMLKRVEDTDLAKRMKIAENQNHDYAWGIVLEKPITYIKNELVDTPIFKGKITVERIGSFSEYSLFQKRKYEVEREVAIRNRMYKPKRSKFPRLRISQDATKPAIHFGDDKYQYITMKECYYMHEPSKKLADNILRVTKTDSEGRTRTSIIISPIEYTSLRSPELRDFIKNIYLSDYMLDIAEENGGYAGYICAKNGGFYISNAYSHEQISSAILFSNGQKGKILDCRDMENRVKYKNVTKDDFLRLLNRPEREKLKNE